MGCNFSCKFCQNNSLSVVPSEAHIYGETVSPRELVDMALKYDADSIAYTYSEPVIFYEYMYDVAALARKQNIGSVMISNGYINEKPLRLYGPPGLSALLDKLRGVYGRWLEPRNRTLELTEIGPGAALPLAGGGRVEAFAVAHAQEITLALGDITVQDFALQTGATVSGRVYVDADPNAVLTLALGPPNQSTSIDTVGFGGLNAATVIAAPEPA